MYWYCPGCEARYKKNTRCEICGAELVSINAHEDGDGDKLKTPLQSIARIKTSSKGGDSK